MLTAKLYIGSRPNFDAWERFPLDNPTVTTEHATGVWGGVSEHTAILTQQFRYVSAILSRAARRIDARRVQASRVPRGFTATTKGKIMSDYREYMGVGIEPYTGRASYAGWKWQAFLGFGKGWAYAETLAGIKELIRQSRGIITY